MTMTPANISWNSGLTGPHLSIAAFPGTPLRVMAGPGTGKTFALMRRIARLLQNGVPPQSILAVTFTRTAASDLLDQPGPASQVIPPSGAVVSRARPHLPADSCR